MGVCSGSFGAIQVDFLMLSVRHVHPKICLRFVVFVFSNVLAVLLKSSHPELCVLVSRFLALVAVFRVLDIFSETPFRGSLRCLKFRGNRQQKSNTTLVKQISEENRRKI